MRRGKKSTLEAVTVRISTEHLATVDKLAVAEDRDRSAMVRILLREALAVRANATSQ